MSPESALGTWRGDGGAKGRHETHRDLGALQKSPFKVEWKPPPLFLPSREGSAGSLGRKLQKHSSEKGVQDMDRECGWSVGCRGTPDPGRGGRGQILPALNAMLNALDLMAQAEGSYSKL